MHEDALRGCILRTAERCMKSEIPGIVEKPSFTIISGRLMKSGEDE